MWYSTRIWWEQVKNVAWCNWQSKILFIWVWPFVAIISLIALVEDITSNRS